MTWRDAVVLAARSVRRRFGRTVLTVLAVALAAALLTALLTIAGTARTRVLSGLAQGGPLASIKVAAAAPDPGQIDTDAARPGPPKDLDQTAVDRIARLPDVASVVPLIANQWLLVPPTPPWRPGTVGTSHGAPSPSSSSPPGVTVPRPAPNPYPRPWVETVVGVDLRHVADVPVTVLAGRLPSPGSLTEVAVTAGYLERLHLDPKQPDVVVGTQLILGAPRVFPSLGEETIRGLWVKAEIVGVVAQEAATGEVLAPIQQTRRAQSFSSQGPNAGGLRLSTSPYSGMIVVANGLDRIGHVRNQITAIGYSTSAPENLIASVMRYLQVVEIVLTGIGMIALVIASLGIASALLAAVRERRREIGVLKAIGARDRDVLRVFLVEAAALGFVGGVLGTLAGWGVARLVGTVVNRYLAAQGLEGVSLGLSWIVFLGGILGSTLLALVAGALPAMRAARLPAREAVGGA